MRFSRIWKLAAASALAVTMMAPGMMRAQGSDTVLKPAEMQKLLPATVFYRGQSAPTQLRNSGGVKLADGYYVLAALVDTSGYTTGVQAKYQAYFIAEVPIKVGGQSLAAGAYGLGVVDNKLLVTDLGAHDVVSVATSDDAGMKRPMPLQVVADPAGGFRLYAQRKYVIFNR
jgi:acetyl-CoA carboxylase carboxyltransferase component